MTVKMLVVFSALFFFSHLFLDKPPAAGFSEEETRGADLSHVSSPSAQSSCVKEGSAAVAVDSLFHDSSIQRIIDKYTRELNMSLSTAGRTTGILL